MPATSFHVTAEEARAVLPHLPSDEVTLNRFGDLRRLRDALNVAVQRGTVDLRTRRDSIKVLSNYAHRHADKDPLVAALATRADAHLLGSVPLRVLRDRGPLSPMEAVALYLVEEARLTQSDAAARLGIEPGQFRTHLARARQKS